MKEEETGSGNIRTGVDIVEISRIQRILKKDKAGFYNKIFTKGEIDYIEKSGNKAPTVAGIFSAKESIAKLLASGIGKLSWQDIEIKHSEKGKPYVEPSKTMKDLLEYNNISSIDISISHEKAYAISLAVGIGRGEKGIQIPSEIREIKLSRKKDSHKGSYGRLGIIGGSAGMTGAPYLTAQAALRTGSGLVYSIVPRSISDIMSVKFNEVIVKSVPDNNKACFREESIEEVLKLMEDMDVLALGPGMGVDEERLNMLDQIISSYERPLVIDADGINCLAMRPEILLNKKGPIILTPHPGEFARLVGKTIGEVQSNRAAYARDLANKYQIILVLKGNETIVACPGEEHIYINSTGNPGMATAGSGDVLTGIIASLLGQGLEGGEAARFGVFVHGLAGDLVSIEKGEHGLIGGDIVKMIPRAIKEIQK